MKKILVTIAAIAGFQTMAQQNPTMDNYLFNPVSISPAYAGQQSGQVQSVYDAQWIGLKGAPRTGAVYYDYMSPGRFGFNLGLVDDQVGPMRTQNLGISTAYHLQVAEETYFAVGIRYTLGHSSVDFTDEFYWDKIDQSIYDIDGPWLQNVDLSGTIHGKDWYIGGTMKNMVRQEIYQNNFTARVAHLFAGNRITLNELWTANPSILVNLTENSPVDINLHSYFEYKDQIGVGVNFSPRDELGVFIKGNVSDGWQLFYQFNYPLSELVFITQQSHVIGVGVNLGSKKNTNKTRGFFL